MKPTNFGRILAVAVFLAIVAVSVYAGIVPSQPNAMTILSNSTRAYLNGTNRTNTRGYIYTTVINQSQITQKWLAYVGNISAEFSLEDISGNQIYDWQIVTTTGEVYATKETGIVPRNALYNDRGGVPSWPNMTCANSSMLIREEFEMNHSVADEDSYRRTFKDAGFTTPDFYVGEKLITNTQVAGAEAGANCAGANLYTYSGGPGDIATKNWTEVVLTDLQSEDESNSPWPGSQFNIIYAALIQNNSAGYNGQSYDFQMLLPQSGANGSVTNIPFYFYVELV